MEFGPNLHSLYQNSLPPEENQPQICNFPDSRLPPTNVPHQDPLQTSNAGTHGWHGNPYPYCPIPPQTAGNASNPYVLPSTAAGEWMNHNYQSWDHPASERPTINSLPIQSLFHGNLNEFFCHICNRSFSNHRLLLQHFAIHENDRYVRPPAKPPANLLTNIQNRPDEVPNASTSSQVDDQVTAKPPEECRENENNSKKTSDKKKSKTAPKDKNHVCLVCHKRFKIFSALKRHMPVHSKEKPFPCHHCDKRFTHRCNRDNHMRNHVPKEKRPQVTWTCRHCERVFDSWYARKKHEGLEHNKGTWREKGEEYKCDLCPKIFYSSSGFCKHKKQHDAGVAIQYSESHLKFPCQFCTMRFLSSQGKVKHEKVKHKLEREKALNFKCRFCERVYFSEGGRRKHERMQHRKVERRNNGNPAAPVLIFKHEEPAVTCRYCGKKFYTEVGRTKHIVACHKNAKLDECNVEESTSGYRKRLRGKKNGRVNKDEPEKDDSEDDGTELLEQCENLSDNEANNAEGGFTETLAKSDANERATSNGSSDIVIVVALREDNHENGNRSKELGSFGSSGERNYSCPSNSISCGTEQVGCLDGNQAGPCITSAIANPLTSLNIPKFPLTFEASKKNPAPFMSQQATQNPASMRNLNSVTNSGAAGVPDIGMPPGISCFNSFDPFQCNLLFTGQPNVFGGVQSVVHTSLNEGDKLQVKSSSGMDFLYPQNSDVPQNPDQGGTHLRCVVEGNLHSDESNQPASNRNMDHLVSPKGIYQAALCLEGMHGMDNMGQQPLHHQEGVISSGSWTTANVTIEGHRRMHELSQLNTSLDAQATSSQMANLYDRTTNAEQDQTPSRPPPQLNLSQPLKNTATEDLSNERPLQCTVCKKNLKDAKTLRRHMKSHSEERPFTCHVCGKAFKYNSSYKGHMRIHTGEKPYKCRYCFKAFRFVCNRNTHIATHLSTHNVPQRGMKCRVCPLKFSTWYARSKHEAKEHGKGQNGLRNSDSVFHCQICSKVYYSLSGITKHRLLHKSDGGSCKYSVSTTADPIDSNGRKFKCSFCPLEFYTIFGRNKHERVKHNEERMKYNSNSCRFCGKVYCSFGGRIKHERLVHGRKGRLKDENRIATHSLFPCRFCVKSFLSAQGRVQHEKAFHPKEREKTMLEKCRFCSKEFYSIAGVRGHELREHKNERARLKQAGKKIDPQTYQRWSIIAEGHNKQSKEGDQEGDIVVGNKCPFCPRVYYTKDGLRKHTRLKHFKEREPLLEKSKLGKKYECKHCPNTYHTQGGLRKHCRLKHKGLYLASRKDSGKPKINCPLCPRSYESLNALRKHKRLKHASALLGADGKAKRENHENCEETKRRNLRSSGKKMRGVQILKPGARNKNEKRSQSRTYRKDKEDNRKAKAVSNSEHDLVVKDATGNVNGGRQSVDGGYDGNENKSDCLHHGNVNENENNNLSDNGNCNLDNNEINDADYENYANNDEKGDVGDHESDADYVPTDEEEFKYTDDIQPIRGSSTSSQSEGDKEKDPKGLNKENQESDVTKTPLEEATDLDLISSSTLPNASSQPSYKCLFCPKMYFTYCGMKKHERQCRDRGRDNGDHSKDKTGDNNEESLGVNDAKTKVTEGHHTVHVDDDVKENENADENGNIDDEDVDVDDNGDVGDENDNVDTDGNHDENDHESDVDYMPSDEEELINADDNLSIRGRPTSFENENVKQKADRNLGKENQECDVTKTPSKDRIDPDLPTSSALSENTVRQGQVPSIVKLYTCHCSRTYSSSAALKKHERIKHKNVVGETKSSKAIFQCQYCPKTYQSLKVFQQHSLLYHQNVVSLSECLKKHVNSECQFCGEVFSSFDELTKHRNTHHKEERSDADAKKTLKKHQDGASPQPSYKCLFCPKMYFTYCGMKKHERQCHRAERDNAIKCKFCSKLSFSKEAIAKHMQEKHKDLLTSKDHFKCRICDKVYYTVSGRRKHESKAHVIVKQ